MNFLFWNINQKRLGPAISALSKAYAVDVLVLAESPYSGEELLVELNLEENRFFLPYPTTNCEKIQVFTSFESHFLAPIFEINRFTIRKLSLPHNKQILIGLLHFLDKRSHGDDSQDVEANKWMRIFCEVEGQENILDSLILGDFNMNPFEKPMVMTTGFHATMSKQVAKSGEKTVQNESFRYFYNPMWSLFGDLIDIPSGTYHYPQSEHVTYHWNMYDQVLIRPTLIDRFHHNSLKIICEIPDGESLLRPSGLPEKTTFSDHLPITFSVDLIELTQLP